MESSRSSNINSAEKSLRRVPGIFAQFRERETKRNQKEPRVAREVQPNVLGPRNRSNGL